MAVVLIEQCKKTSLKKYHVKLNALSSLIDLLAILRKSLDQALFLHIFIREVRSSGVRASITIVHIRIFYEM